MTRKADFNAEEWSTVVDEPLMGRIMQGLVSDLATDSELGAAFREQIVAARLAGVRRLVDDGIRRGQ